MKKLKLVFTSELTKPVGPEGGSGVNTIVYNLTEELVRRGYDVTLLASANSKTSARLIPVIDKDLGQYGQLEARVKEIMKVKAASFISEAVKTDDQILVHNHLVWRFVLFTDGIRNVPVLTTMHGDPLSVYANEIYRNSPSNNFFNVLSDNQLKIAREKNVNTLGFVYNGISTDAYTLSLDAKSYLFYVGRISEGKGLSEILDVAKDMDKELFVAGGPDEKEKVFFEEFKNKISGEPKQKYLGEIALQEKNDLISKAKLFLFPVKWEEPFGLVPVESMACGTPVVCYARGALPEIVKDGVTGFLVNQNEESIRGNWTIKKTGLEGLKEAVERIYSMNESEYLEMRKACRKHVEENFTVKIMADKYEEIYRKVTEDFKRKN